MKRWPLRILLCLILLAGGAITTVAVAWGCARFVNPFDGALDDEGCYIGGEYFGAAVEGTIGSIAVLSIRFYRPSKEDEGSIDTVNATLPSWFKPEYSQ